jgi:3-hydroxyacyl-[acyl-carrier-protein] dehydratase
MTDTAGTADLARIMRMIPHRAPFLFIDRVRDIVHGESAVGIKNVTANEPHFAGHFPGKPIMPGVLIVEAMAQTAAVMVVETLDMIDKGMLVYFMTVDKTRFRSPVTPGDIVELHVTVQRHKGNVWRFTGRGMIGDTLCAEAEFSAMIVDPD